MKNRQKAVLTDIDGIFFELVDRCDEFGYSAQTLDELTLIEGLESALNGLKDRDYLILGITNQPDLARGKITHEFLAEKHAMLLQMYPQITKVFWCEHTEFDLCGCRKPKPGLLFKAAEEYDLDISKCWVVGDSRTDIEAGAVAHARTVFVQTRYNVADPAIRIATGLVKSPKGAFDLINVRHDAESARQPS